MARPEVGAGGLAYEDLVRGLSLLPQKMNAGQMGTFTFVVFKEGVPVACGKCMDNSPMWQDGGQGEVDGWNVDASRLGGGGDGGGNGTVAVT